MYQFILYKHSGNIFYYYQHSTQCLPLYVCIFACNCISICFHMWANDEKSAKACTFLSKPLFVLFFLRFSACERVWIYTSTSFWAFMHNCYVILPTERITLTFCSKCQNTSGVDSAKIYWRHSVDDFSLEPEILDLTVLFSAFRASSCPDPDTLLRQSTFVKVQPLHFEMNN